MGRVLSAFTSKLFATNATGIRRSLGRRYLARGMKEATELFSVFKGDKELVKDRSKFHAVRGPFDVVPRSCSSL